MKNFKHIEIQTTFLGLARAEILLEEYNNKKDFVIFLDTLWEVLPPDKYEEIKKFISHIRGSCPQWKIFLLVNTADEIYKDRLVSANADDILFIDYFLYRVYREVITKKKNPVITLTTSLPLDKNKFLCLSGKIKRHRVGLLKKIVETGLIKSASWSFFYNPYRDAEKLKDILPEMSDSELLEFVKTYAQSPDGISFQQGEYHGIPYDINLYASTDFSVVNESYYSDFEYHDNVPWITEKTWIPILNNHPFIILGDCETLKYLKRMGFYTFDTFLKTEYDNITDPNVKINIIAENIEHWLNTLSNYKEEIFYQTHANRQQLEILYLYNLDKILNFIKKNNLSTLAPDDVVSTSGRLDKQSRHELFLKFYNNIRAEEWPECESEDDFFNLPVNIQQECITKFGYVPQVKGLL